MLQDLIRIPLPFNLPLIGNELVIYGFGLMLVIGFLCAMELARFLARRSGIDPEAFANAAMLALFTGILGARLSHVLENLPEYTAPDRTFLENLGAALNITSGGLTYYGGFLLAFPTLLIYGRIKRIPLRRGMDIVAPCLMVGLAFGRVGCFFNGCCFGAICDAPWAVSFPYASPAYEDQFETNRITPPPELITRGRQGQRLISNRELRQGYIERPNPIAPSTFTRTPIPDQAPALAKLERSLRLHPAQLYSAFTAFVLAGLLIAHFTLPHPPGRTFALMLMLEGAARFSLELVRAEPAVIGPFSFSMAMAIPLIALGIALWFIFHQRPSDARAAPQLDHAPAGR